MSAITLPSTPAPWSATPRYRGFGGPMTPPLGGQAQSFSRLGDRWGVDFVFPALAAPYAEAFIAARVKARKSGSTVQIGFPQPAVGAATAGAGAQVNGGSQTGTSLVIKNCAGGTIPAGSFFSVSVSGRNYLYMVDTALALSGGGGTASIGPMLRASPADGAAVNFVTPQIEGFLSGTDDQWTLAMLKWTSFKFSVDEVA